MKKVILIVVLFFISPSIFAEIKYPEAPFGLKWGMTVEELESKAGTVNPIPIDENTSLYSLKSPPITLLGFTEYYVLVHKKLGAMEIIKNEK